VRDIRSANIPRFAAAGSLSISDTARLLRIRGLPCRGGAGGCRRMAALLGLDYEAAVAVANEAAQGQVCQPPMTMVAAGCGLGDRAAVERCVGNCQNQRRKRAMLLPVSAPFHCRLMQPAAMRWPKRWLDVIIRQPSRHWCRTCCRADYRSDEIRRRPDRTGYGTVRWRESVAYMASQGVTRFFGSAPARCSAGWSSALPMARLGFRSAGQNDIASAKQALAAARTA